MARSRLSRNLERKSQKTFFLTLTGIVIILFLLVKFGIPLLINFSLFVANHKGDSAKVSSQKKNSTAFVEAPILNGMPTATNSARVIISGKASSKETIKLYVNSDLTDTADTNDKGQFSFQNVTLQKGDNTIKAKAENDNKNQSDFSDTMIIAYKEAKITLSVDSPSDGQHFSKDDNFATVTGKTDPGNKVTVNGFWAIVNGNGNYSYRLPLQNGDNNIKVEASDDAGNKMNMEKKVTYSQ